MAVPSRKRPLTVRPVPVLRDPTTNESVTDVRAKAKVFARHWSSIDVGKAINPVEMVAVALHRQRALLADSRTRSPSWRPSRKTKTLFFSLDLCKEYVKKTGLLTFGWDLSWQDACKESLLRIRKAFWLIIITFQRSRRICVYYSTEMHLRLL